MGKISKINTLQFFPSKLDPTTFFGCTVVPEGSLNQSDRSFLLYFFLSSHDLLSKHIS